MSLPTPSTEAGRAGLAALVREPRRAVPTPGSTTATCTAGGR